MSLRSRYERFKELANSPQSIDCGRCTIYSFPKFCKRCNEGLEKPKQWDPNIEKDLFSSGFCSEECRELGGRPETTFPLSVKKSHFMPKASHAIEEAALLALQLEEGLRSITGVKRLVAFAELNFKLLSEKLSFLEYKTGKKWYPTKFYYQLNKISVL